MPSRNRDIALKGSVDMENMQCIPEEMKHQVRAYVGQKKFLANNWIAFWTLLTTIIFQAFSFWMYFGMHSSCLFVLTNSLAILRWFMIFHDCTHLSFWESTTWCIRFGHLLSPLVASSFTPWRNDHVLHHMTSGDLTSTKHEFNGTIFYTVRQYLQLPASKRYLYRFFRDPWVFFTIVPFIHFFIMHRFEKGALMANVEMLIYNFILYYFGGVHFFGLSALSIAFASAVGMMLFHLQHSYNPAYVNVSVGQYSKFESGLHGSSYIIMPPILKWFSLGIEYHHIHHINTQIPGYHLEHSHNEAPPHFWDDVFIFDSFQKIIDSLNNTLWDEEQHRFVGFSQILH